MNKPWSIAQRLWGSATLWILFPLILGGLFVAHYLQAPIIETLDRQIKGDLDRLVEFTRFSPEGELMSFQRYYEDGKYNQVKSGWYWQIIRTKDQLIVGRSLSMKGFTIPFSKYPNSESPTLLYGAGPSDADLQVMQIKVKDSASGIEYNFLVGANPKFVIDAIDRVNNRVAIAFGLMGLFLLFGTFFQVRFGLQPLRKLKNSLLAIREGATKHFDEAYPPEIKPLTDELNAHLRHTEEVLSKARGEVGNLAHALKTPISVIGNENRKPTPQNQEIIQAEIEKVERHINSYLLREKEIYRNPLTNEVTNLLSVIRSLSSAIKKQYFDKKTSIHVQVEGELNFRGSQSDLEEILGNLLENAAKYSKKNVWIKAEVIEAVKSPLPMLILSIDDDGPGIPEDIRDTMLSRGKRYDETVPGQGFGLSIVNQICTLYGGSIELASSPKGGLRAILKLPRSYSF